MKDTGGQGLCGIATAGTYPVPSGGGALHCNPKASPPERCPEDKPCPASGVCPE